MIRWVNIFTNNIQSSIVQNGCLSELFNIGIGCRQGDPVSSYCFLLSVEVLSILVRQNKLIKGITIGSRELKLSQFADDTSLILDGSKQSFDAAIDIIICRYIRPQFKQR